MADFSIDCRWKPALYEIPEVRETSAMLKIILGSKVVTQNKDIWSQTVSDEARLSSYPLALWFASSWWRLLWEPLPVSSTPNHSWRMAHELAASGQGYVWPRMLFASDGELIQIWAVKSKPDSVAAVRYLVDANHIIQSAEFERVLDEFINHVIARLDTAGIQNTPLHDVWREVTEERRDDGIAAYRRLEAMLGFDPDECPEHLHDQLSGLIPQIGDHAVAEIAPVCASPQPDEKLRNIIEFAKSEGLEARVDIPDQGISEETVPWRRGRNLARKVRAWMGLESDLLDNRQLYELLGLSEKQALNAPTHSHPPLGMSIRHNKKSKILLSKHHTYDQNRRFELSRHLADHLIADKNDVWLPVARTKTARQKIQRAFAAELLCPIQALEAYLDGNFSMDAVEDASEHFGVSYRAAQTQLVNNGLLSPTILSEDGFFGFPYFFGDTEKHPIDNSISAKHV